MLMYQISTVVVADTSTHLNICASQIGSKLDHFQKKKTSLNIIENTKPQNTSVDSSEY